MNVIISNEETRITPETGLNILDALASTIYSSTEDKLNEIKKRNLKRAMECGRGRGVYVKCVLRAMEFFKEYRALLKKAAGQANTSKRGKNGTVYVTDSDWRSEFILKTVEEKGLLPIAAFLWLISGELDYESLLENADVVSDLMNEKAYLDYMNALKELHKINKDSEDIIEWLGEKFGPDTVLDAVKNTPLEGNIDVLYV